MTVDELVRTRVHEYYWHNNWNCATTTLKILSEHFGVPLHDQVLDAAIGMHGAGGFQAQCGLVEGALLFVGIYGKHRQLPEQDIVDACYAFAEQFQSHFGSLSCQKLRPQGFSPDDPPHMCTPLTEDAILFILKHLSNLWP